MSITFSSGCEAAHGLSFYVETKNHKLLFDTSPSEVVIRNAQKLGVDLTTVDAVILSHGHYDHSGGEYYAFDGEEQGYRYIGIDKKITALPQVQLLKGDTRIDDELQVFTQMKEIMGEQLTYVRSGDEVLIE